MKRVVLILGLLGIFTVCALAQTALVPVSWVSWGDEPQTAEPAGQGYANVPYEKAVYVAPHTPEGWAFDPVSLDFDAAWSAIEGDAVPIAHPGRIDGGDIYDGGSTFGAEWKAMYDSAKVYVLFKYVDAFLQADDGSRAFEVCMQPFYYDRYEPDFIAAGDDITLQNNSYARYIELGGGKALFRDGFVSEYHSSVGADGLAAFGPNEIGLTKLLEDLHYWSVEPDNTIKAVFVVDIGQVLSSAIDPFGDISDPGNRVSMDPINTAEDDTIAFEVKSNATMGGSANYVEYWWSSEVNDGYASLYYNGYLILQQPTVGSVEDLNSMEVRIYLRDKTLILKDAASASMDIFSIGGQLVKSARHVNRLDVSDLDRGIYLVKLDQENKAYKFVIH